MKPYEYFRNEFMDVMRELREGKLSLDEALDTFKDLENHLANEIAREKKAA